MPGPRDERRRRREEGGELIESEQRISGMAYSSFGSLLLFFFLPARLSPLRAPLPPSPAVLRPSPPLHPAARAVLRSSLYPLRSGYQGGSVEGRRGSRSEEGEEAEEAADGGGGSIPLSLRARI